MSPATWEDVVYEWAHSLGKRYARVEQCRGAGDLGRDIVGYESDTNEDPWDNYQCKHYAHRLKPIDAWPEIGKVAYYSHMGEYTLPRNYAFVAPLGAGVELSKLLNKPQQMKDGLVRNWDGYCLTKITKKHVVKLEGSLLHHVMAMDFSIFRVLSPLRLIDDLRTTPMYAVRFGGGLAERGKAPDPPAMPAPHEANYVRALLDAYGERLGRSVTVFSKISDAGMEGHFSRSRREFYSAESLREFSQDNVPPGTFESLQDEFYSGIIDAVEASYKDGYGRVLGAVKQAKSMQVTANALMWRVRTPDKGGICHQLANDLRVRWRR